MVATRAFSGMADTSGPGRESIVPLMPPPAPNRVSSWSVSGEAAEHRDVDMRDDGLCGGGGGGCVADVGNAALVELGVEVVFGVALALAVAGNGFCACPLSDKSKLLMRFCAKS